jgi:hypothetical protein
MTHIEILRKHLKSPAAIAEYVNEALRGDSIEYAQLAFRQLNEAKGCNLPTRKSDIRILMEMVRKSNFSLRPPSKNDLARHASLT